MTSLSMTSLSALFIEVDGRQLLSTFALFILGIISSKIAALLIARAVRSRLGAGGAQLAHRFTWYILLSILISHALSRLGVDLTVFLGAAGVLTVAAGFAAQTSAANIISGLFLLGERPFSVGDIIEFEGTIGTIISVDLLSVKVSTFDNLFIRIPNELMLKKSIVNLSHHKIRRVDISFLIGRDESLKEVLTILSEVVQQSPHCLDEPEPVFMFNGVTPRGQELIYCVWCSTELYLQVKNEFQLSAYQALKEARVALGVELRVVQKIDAL
jgi:small-conductance mechanosensitive channel